MCLLWLLLNSTVWLMRSRLSWSKIVPLRVKLNWIKLNNTTNFTRWSCSVESERTTFWIWMDNNMCMLSFVWTRVFQLWNQLFLMQEFCIILVWRYYYSSPPPNLENYSVVQDWCKRIRATTPLDRCWIIFRFYRYTAISVYAS